MRFDPSMVIIFKMRRFRVFFVSTKGRLSVTVTILWYEKGEWTPGASGVED